MLQNRTRIEILANVLNVAQSGALKTHIMYKANLSHKQLQRYLSYLVENRLLEQVYDVKNGDSRFRVTSKGIQFLQDYSRLSAHLELTSRG